MNRQQIITFIFEIASQQNAFDRLEQALSQISLPSLQNYLLECEVIPEQFPHDSSEEKLWAKYCDILLAHSLTKLGIPAQVIRARGNSADVWGATETYSIVGEAKAFRLSRTAKNQKDFKVTALDDWRKKDTFACLVAPLYQYPQKESQIYAQAIERNVTLLSYTHLLFLLQHKPVDNLHLLWSLTRAFSEKSKNALDYWQQVDTVICQVTQQSLSKLLEAKQNTVKITQKLGQEGILFWQSTIQQYQQLSQSEAVAKLILAEKIQNKIDTIRQAIEGKKYE